MPRTKDDPNNPRRLDEFDGRPFYLTEDGRKVTPDGEPFVEGGDAPPPLAPPGEPPKE